uniref:hypothetical protein n=1 Tax=Paenibacillus zanthoxyli TaxID=369399 RepID=UPI000569576F
MASRYDQFVAGQRKRAEGIKKSTMDGTLQSQRHSKSITSRSDAFRANSVRKSEEDRVKSSALLTDTLAGVGIGQPAPLDMSANAPAPVKRQPATLQNTLPAPSLLQQGNPIQQKTSNLQRALAGKLPASSAVIPSGGGPANASQIPGVSQYRMTQQEIDNSGAPAAVKAFATSMNYLTRGNPIGNFVSNSFSGNSGVTHRDTTGNRVLDRAADAINNFVTPLLTPTGAPIGMGPNMGTYQAAEQALAGRAGQGAVQRIPGT